MMEFFKYDERLNILVPHLLKDFSEHSSQVQNAILTKWEEIRGTIPDKIKLIEQTINHKLALLNDEEDFEISCQLNYEIADLASKINDLWIWYRTDQSITGKTHS